MRKHLSVEPENRGFARILEIINTGASFEAVQNVVNHVERAAAENRADHRFAMGMRAAFIAVAQTLRHRDLTRH